MWLMMNIYNLEKVVWQILTWILVIILTLCKIETALNLSPKDSICAIKSIQIGLDHIDFCATIAFKRSMVKLSGMNFTSSTITSLYIKDNVVKMENKFATAKIQILLSYIASRHKWDIGVTNEIYCCLNLF